MSLGSLASSSRIVSVGLIGGIARRSPVIARQLTSKRFLSTSHSGTLGGGESASYLNKLGNGAASSRLQMPMRAAVAYYNQHPLQRRSFHATNPRNGLPHIAALLAFLKSSYTLSAVQTIGRVTMSLFPIVIFKKKLFQRFLRQMDPNSPNAAIKYERFRRYIEYTRKIIFVLLGIPFGFFWLTVLASSERTPLTGRWRVILLSPAEEEEICNDLKGNRWYDAVFGILTSSSTDGAPPPIVPRDDWRWRWVEDTLRRLERAAVSLQDTDAYRELYEKTILSFGDKPDAPVLPPPPKYPLLPRSRASALLHEMPLTSEYDHMDQIPRHSHSSQDLHTHHISPHSQLGPPYSLLLVDKNESNAISYGFGPGGAGGVVVYSGFLDDVLREPSKSQPSPSPVVQAPSPSPSLWGALTSSLGLRSSSPQPPQPTFPTPEQTSRLAVLLAHELSHLILSHHIETLSSGTILIPSIISICVDTIRTVLYPLTFMVGPFVGDALDKTLRVSFEDVTRAGESCTSRKLEIEADIVSTRLLAIAGFDPRDAVTFWEERVKQAEMAALSASQSETQSLSLGNYWKPGSAHGNTQGGGGPNTQVTHPASVERVKSIRDELSSWDKERMTVLKRLLDERMAQSRSESVVAGA